MEYPWDVIVSNIPHEVLLPKSLLRYFAVRRVRLSVGAVDTTSESLGGARWGPFCRWGSLVGPCGCRSWVRTCSELCSSGSVLMAGGSQTRWCSLSPLEGCAGHSLGFIVARLSKSLATLTLGSSKINQHCWRFHGSGVIAAPQTIGLISFCTGMHHEYFFRSSMCFRVPHLCSKIPKINNWLMDS